MSGQALAIAALGAVLYFAGLGVVEGTKWVGHEVKHGAAKIVHALKHIPH